MRINAQSNRSPAPGYLSSGLPALPGRLTSRGSLFVYKEQNVAGLASQGAADFLQRFKIDSDCLAFFQPPQSRMTDARLLRQPIETALFNGQ